MFRNIVFLLLLCLNLPVFGQSIIIYRHGTALTPSYYSTGTALYNALDGDSLVFSADTFDGGYRINKSLVIQGTISGGDTTSFDLNYSRGFYVKANPDSTNPVKITFRDVIIENGFLTETICYFDSPDPYQLKGSGIRADSNTVVRLTGNTVIRNNHVGELTSGSWIPDYTLSNVLGGGIYSAGKLFVEGHTYIHSNAVAYAGSGGGIFCSDSLIISGHVVIAKNGSLKLGGAIASNRGVLIIKDSVAIKDNAAILGGGIYLNKSTMLIQDNVSLTNNAVSDYFFHSYGGGLCSDSSIIDIKNNGYIADNITNGYGGGICLRGGSWLTINDSVQIRNNVTTQTAGAGIYASGANIIMNGGQIIYNHCYDTLANGEGMAVYVDSIDHTPVLIDIRNARVFNPSMKGKQNEISFKSDSVIFKSDSTWWGRSDTSGVFLFDTNMVFNLNSWIIANWSLNGGIPAGLSTSFPVSAMFTMHSGAALPSYMFWMLEGNFYTDEGTFIPSKATMSITNIIQSTYNVPVSAGVAHILGVIDADSFGKDEAVTGSLLIDHNTIHHELTVYPNPSNGSVTLSGAEVLFPITATVYDLIGQKLTHQLIKRNQSKLTLELPAGIYIFEALNEKGFKYRKKMTIGEK